MDSLPARNGPASRLAFLMHERGLTARISTVGAAHVLTIGNPAVLQAQLTQKVAFVPGNGGSDGLFLWLFDGPQRGTWDAEPLGPASEVDEAADRIIRVLSLGGQPDA